MGIAVEDQIVTPSVAGRPRRLLVIYRIARLAIATALLAGCAPLPPGDGPGRAVVGGVEYDISIVRSLHIQVENLAPFERVTSIESGYRYVDDMTYAINGVPPGTALAMRLAPGQEDDEPLGNYVLLIRGPDAFEKLCPYFDPAAPATPSICR